MSIRHCINSYYNKIYRIYDFIIEFLANYNLFVQRGKLYIRVHLELLDRKIAKPIYKLQRNATSPVLGPEQNCSLCYYHRPRYFGCLVWLETSRFRHTGAYGVGRGRNKVLFNAHVSGSEINFFREKGHTRPAPASTQKPSLGSPCHVSWWGGVDTSWPGDALSDFADLVFSHLYVVLNTHIWKSLFCL